MDTKAQQTVDLSGKVCLITGANSGLGKATSLALARMGAQVVMLSRDAQRGQAAVDEVRRESNNSRVELLLADVSSQRSIRKAADEFKSRHDKLHVLVNNAGVNLGSRQVTEDGIESTFAINHLGPFLLTHLLLDVLKASAPSRVIMVGSGAHSMGKLRFEDLQFEKKYSAMGAYSQSKLANVMYTYELARRLSGTGVTVNCADPGTVATSLGSDQWIFRFLVKLPFFQTPEKGAATAVHLASAPELQGVTGKYFAKQREAKSSERSLDAEASKRLWEESARLVHVA
jgi:NAD(P)-dependent dehydrogenase (short-subunit alcohol dehydrogenase family)